MNNRYRIPFLLFIFSLTAGSLFPSTPLWLQIDNGKTAIEKGDLGTAVLIFREVLKKDTHNPEAQKWLGYIYAKEGEFQLAVRQYQKALENKKTMLVKEDQYFILYRLADIYNTVHRSKEYRETLEKIIKIVPGEKIPAAMQDAMISFLKKNGIDKFFELYRPEAKITLKAHYLLGMDYFQKKKYDEALKHFIFSIGEPVSVMTAHMRMINPDYTYTITKKISPMEKLLERAGKDRYVAAYLKKVSFYRSLLYAGEAVVYRGYRKNGMRMIELVLQFSPDLTVKNRARLFYIR